MSKLLQILGSEAMIKGCYVLLIISMTTCIWWNPPLTAWMITHPFWDSVILFSAAVLAIFLVWVPGYIRYGVLKIAD